jgi:hypothetical protein
MRQEQLHITPELLALYVELAQLCLPHLGKVTDIVEMME